MKAIRNFAIIAAMASFVVACGGKNEPAAETPTTDTVAAEPTEEPTPAPADSTATSATPAADAPEAAPAPEAAKADAAKTEKKDGK